MAGLLNPEAARLLAGRIRKLYDEALNLGTKETTENSGKIGRVFQDLAKKDPGYFATRPELLEHSDQDDLIRQINARYGFGGTEHKMAPLGSLGLRVESGTGAEAGNFGSLRDAGELGEGILRAMKPGVMRKSRAGINPDSKVWVGDTMAVNPGQGANQFYRGFYDMVLSDPDAVNISRGLSNANSFRRTANMVPAYERYGDTANRLVMDSDQLTPTASGRQNFGKVHAFHSMPTEAQIGLMNSILTQRSADQYRRLGETLLDKARYSDQGSMAREIGVEGLRKLKELRMDPEAPWVPSTDVDEHQLRGLAELMQRVPRQLKGESSPVGYDSLRRAAITADADAGLSAGDLLNQPWLTKGLGRRQGGHVPSGSQPKTSPLTRLFE